MQYIVEPIGKEFSKKAIKALEVRLSDRYAEGYRFHSVFEVSQPGCLGIGAPSITFIAVFEKI
ncbi:MAG: hypothetical protein AAGI14_06180 [Pseudomonadota bacterium]